ncbi:hypothetical protein [Streptomyces galbus]|uniref:DUF3558 domain-containing protein n=1 Tax=Streptomyces galbus TaxID=33898 RepID=A0A4U5W8V5_STRGB|nr:hypothetical protein [Streptomyces galbus]TKS98043.1 hypothetical protein E4U92_30785 [Streptomyces galbus]GHD43454.1 hypothetical protein GCM10010335_47100 [Streptomyces galbus]
MLFRVNRKIATACVLVSILVGCSTDSNKKEYASPEALCEVPVDAGVLSKLLPPGEKIAVQERNPTPHRKRCQVNVDGRVALIASQEWWEDGDGIDVVAHAFPQLKSAQLSGDGTSLHTGTGALRKVEACGRAGYSGYTLFTAIQVYARDVDDSVAVKKLIDDYTDGVVASATCR